MIEQQDISPEAREFMRSMYGENQQITDDNYDKSLAVKCINGTFVGKKKDNVIAYKGGILLWEKSLSGRWRPLFPLRYG